MNKNFQSHLLKNLKNKIDWSFYFLYSKFTFSELKIFV